MYSLWRENVSLDYQSDDVKHILSVVDHQLYMQFFYDEVEVCKKDEECENKLHQTR